MARLPYRVGWSCASAASLFLFLTFASSNARAADAAAGDEAVGQATASMETGDFRTAAAQWNSAAESFEKSRQVPQRIDALAGLAAADEGLGQYQAAVDTYRQAIDAARPLGDGRRVLLLEIRAAEACTLARTGGMGESLFDVAQNYLDDVSRAPEASSDPEVISALNSAKGNLALASGRPAEALRMYRDVYGAAEKAGDHASAARAAANAGVAALAAARDASDALAAARRGGCRRSGSTRGGR